MIDIATLVTIVIYLLVIGGICWLLWWLVSFIGLPAPFDKIARAIIAVVAVVACINLLLMLGGMTPIVKLK